MDKELLAQIVWSAVTSNGSYFTPRDEELSSWVSNEQRENVEQNEMEFRKLVQEKEKAA